MTSGKWQSCKLQAVGVPATVNRETAMVSHYISDAWHSGDRAFFTGRSTMLCHKFLQLPHRKNNAVNQSVFNMGKGVNVLMIRAVKEHQKYCM